MLDSALHQPGTGWCFRGDEEELEGVSIRPPVGYRHCRLTQQPGSPCDRTIGVARGTDTVSVSVLEGSSGFA